MNTPLRILIVEDVEQDALLVELALRNAGIHGALNRAASRSGFLSQLKSAPPDVILSDYSLPSFSGREALALTRELAPDIPFIVVSGAIGEETAIELMQAGATDYVLKSRLPRLGAAVKRALEERAERQQKAAFEKELRQSNEQLRALTARLETFREEERTRIARELHDELGQSLTALKLDIEWIRRRLGAEHTELARKAHSMSDLIDRTMHSMRRIATELRPNVLDDLGLHAAIEWMARDTEQRTGIVCTVHMQQAEFPLDSARSTAMFRIFQEALTNVVRHAGATHADISLRTEDDALLLSVCDNGKGIEESGVVGRESLGILGMRERARMVGGTVEIVPQTANGTRVSVRIPVRASAE